MARRRSVALYNYCLFDAPRLSEKYGLTINPAERLGRCRRGACSRFQAPKPRDRVLDDAEILAWCRALDASVMQVLS